MGGGTLQLVIQGGQDIYILGTLKQVFLNLFTVDTPIFPLNV